MLEALGGTDRAARFDVYVPFAPARSDWPANVSIRPAAIPRTRTALAAWELALAARQAARDGVDLLHYLYPAGSLVPTRLPVVLNIFDTIEWTVPGYSKSRIERMLERRHLRAADRVIVPTEKVGADLAETLSVPLEKVRVVPLGGPRINPGADARQPYWLFVGGTEKRKNLRLVLQALAEDPSQSMRLKIVGATSAGPRYDSRSELEALLQPAERGRLDWLGEIPPAELGRLYTEAVALIYPSLAEGFGYPPLEAMARGTPVIAAPVPSIAKGFEDAALLVDPLEPSQLGDAMRRVLSDPALCRRLTDRGFDLVSRYDWDETAERTLAVYRGLLDH